MSTTETLTMNRILNTASERQATDIHFDIGSNPVIRVKGVLYSLDEEELVNPEGMASIISFFMPDVDLTTLKQQGELDFVYDWLDKARFRVHIFQQKGNFAVAIKLVNPQIKNPASLGLPKVVANFTKAGRGLVIVTGPFNSGRSTTLNSLLETINQTRSEHILYLEKPIEYLFVNGKSIVEQQEVGRDIPSFEAGLEAAKDADVNIIAVARVAGVGVMEKILELCESGRLVFAIMDYDTVSAALDALIAQFPDAKNQWAKNVLSEFLIGAVAQRLIPAVSGDVVLAAEVLVGSPSAKGLIKDGNITQLDTVIQTSMADGMVSMDRSILGLLETGKINLEEAGKNISEPRLLKGFLNR